MFLTFLTVKDHLVLMKTNYYVFPLQFIYILPIFKKEICVLVYVIFLYICTVMVA